MWKNYPQPSRRQAMKDMEIMQQAIKNPNPCLNKDTTRWKEGERKLYKVKDGRKIYETLQRKKDNIKLSKAIFRIKTENRKDRSIEVGPGWRQGPSGLIIDCYETQKFGAKEFGALHGREYKMKKELKLRKLMDEELARHIAMYKSEYSVKYLQEDYNRKRNLVSKTPRVDPTAIHLDLYGPNAKKKNTIVRGLVKIEPKELDLPEWDSSPTKEQEKKKSIYAHALAMQKFNITVAPSDNYIDCSKFRPPYRVRVNKLENTKNVKARPKSASTTMKSTMPQNLTEISYVSTGISKKMVLPEKEFNQPYPTINISDEELIKPSKILRYRPNSANAILTNNKEFLKHRILHGREPISQYEINEEERFSDGYHNVIENFTDHDDHDHLVSDDLVLKTTGEIEEYIGSHAYLDDGILPEHIEIEDPYMHNGIQETLYDSNARRSYIGSCEVPGSYSNFSDSVCKDNNESGPQPTGFNFTVDVFDVGFNFPTNDSTVKTSAGIFLEGKPNNTSTEIQCSECVEFVPFDIFFDLVKEFPDLYHWLTSYLEVNVSNITEEMVNSYSEFKLTNSLIDALEYDSSSDVSSKILNAIRHLFRIKITKGIDSDEYCSNFVY